MDGSLAAVFWLASLAPTHVDDPSTNMFHLERVERGGRLAISTGMVEHQERPKGWEGRVTYIFDEFLLDRFNPTFDVSITDKGGGFIAFGLYQQIDFSIGDVDMFIGLSFAPGLQFEGSEIDLGCPLEFRSGAEIGFRLPDQWQVSLLYDHRSNADLGLTNPGMETYQLRISHALNW